jgi:hypothetical protein
MRQQRPGRSSEETHVSHASPGFHVGVVIKAGLATGAALNDKASLRDQLADVRWDQLADISLFKALGGSWQEVALPNVVADRSGIDRQ